MQGTVSGSLAPSHVGRQGKLDLEGTGAKTNPASGHHPIWIILGDLTSGDPITQSVDGLGRISANIWE